MPKTQRPLTARKPFRVLSLMDAEEIRQFVEFVGSDLATGQVDHQLHEFLIQCVRLKVWQKIYGPDQFLKESGLDMNENIFNKVISRLYRQLMSFAAIKALLARPNHCEPLSLAYLSEKSAEQEDLEKKVAESYRNLDKLPPNANYHRSRLDLQLVKVQTMHSRAEDPESRKLYLLHEDLDAYFCIQKLRFLCASYNEMEIFYSKWTPTGVEELLSWFQLCYDQMPRLAQAYFHAYMILTGRREASRFPAFRKMLSEWEEEYGQGQEISELYGYLLNHFILQYNRGELTVLPQINDLYDELLARGTLLEEGLLAPEYFKNMISVKCRLGKVDAARKFYGEYIARLTNDQEGAVRIYNDIVIAFHERNYAQVRNAVEPLLESPESTKVDIYYGLDLRCILLKTYLLSLHNADLDTWDEIDDRLRQLIRSFKGYIQRKQIPQLARIDFENFRLSIQRIYSCLYPPLGGATESREELYEDFFNSSNLPDKGWFLSQVAPS